MSDPLEIKLLGEIEVRCGGKVLPLPQSKKTRALLAYLVLEDKSHRRDRLCELLWQVPDDPRGALRWSLSKLRGIVDDEDTIRIKADREHIQFSRDTVIIDAVELEQVFDKGLSLVTTPDLTKIADGFGDAPLSGLCLSDQPEFEAWCFTKTEALKNRQGRVLVDLADRLAKADLDAATGHLRQFVELDHHNPLAHLNLIRFLASHGQNSQAKAQRVIAEKILNEIDAFDASQFDAAEAAAPSPVSAPSQPQPRPDLPPQDIRFCTAHDGVQIAYAAVGSGPPLVKCANWLNHLEYDWESPVWRHIFKAFCDEFSFVRYDSRGNGLSDWNTEEFSFDTMVADLEAVVDAAGLDRFPLLGISQGCAVSIEYAVRHPERVTKLVLFGGYARGWRIESSPEAISGVEAMRTLMLQGWGQDNPAFRQMFTTLFIPDATPEEFASFNELQRMTTSPENAARLLDALGVVDVRHRLAEVQAPTLVIHNRGDMRVAPRRGREMATGIPGAKFVSLESKNHLLLEHDPAWPRFLEVVMAFLNET